MNFSSNMSATAERLIEKYGNDCVLIEVIQGDYDPLVGERTFTEYPHPLKATIQGYQSSDVVPGVIDIDDLVFTVPYTVLDTLIGWFAYYYNQVNFAAEEIDEAKSLEIEYNNKRWIVQSIYRTVAQNNTILINLRMRSK